MAIPCRDINKLKAEILDKYQVTERVGQLGTSFLFADPAYNGFIVNVFNTGNVQFQGGACEPLQRQIENLISFINS
ncbi:hypothetical protein ABN236_19230 [Proteus sp. fly-1013]|uniref:hypothetical protein n=1 Tax=Proteus sp. fly-1013 TaxID=3136673 RepID=UPI00165614C8|nr:hypothetical protein [Providencia sp. G1(2023)]MBC8655066.1 hypothetical protein [Providencia vermicola]